jgi:hypothetical protein
VLQYPKVLFDSNPFYSSVNRRSGAIGMTERREDRAERDLTYVESLRQDPEKFDHLSLKTQMEILEMLFGSAAEFVYIAEDHPNSKYSFIPSYADKPYIMDGPNTTPDWRELQGYNCLVRRISRCYANARWIELGLVLRFFRVKCIAFIGYIGDAEPIQAAFCRVFPFGCFSDGLPLIENLVNQATNWNSEWCLGVPAYNLVRHSLWMEQSLYEVVLVGIQKSEYTSVRVFDILQMFNAHWKIVKYQSRIQEIANTLSQKRLQATLFNLDSIVYPYLANFHYSRVEDFYDRKPERVIEFVPDYSLNIPRPQWSRQSHKSLATPEFRKKTLLILLMQKFRHRQFALHKDLIDTILRHVFNMEIAEMANFMKSRSDRMVEFLNLPPDEQDAICLRQGIISEYYDDWRGDALDLHDGIAIPVKRLEEYHKSLVADIVKWNSVSIQKFRSRIPDCPLEFLGEHILNYCRKVKIDLYALRNGKVWLGEEDFLKIHELCAGVME